MKIAIIGTGYVGLVYSVIPAQAGIHATPSRNACDARGCLIWIPAYAGMTEGE